MSRNGYGRRLPRGLLQPAVSGREAFLQRKSIVAGNRLCQRGRRKRRNSKCPGGFSWIHRWSRTKGMPNKGEPDEPEWVRKAFTERVAPASRLGPRSISPTEIDCCWQ